MPLFWLQQPWPPLPMMRSLLQTGCPCTKEGPLLVSMMISCCCLRIMRLLLMPAIADMMMQSNTMELTIHTQVQSQQQQVIFVQQKGVWLGYTQQAQQSQQFEKHSDAMQVRYIPAPYQLINLCIIIEHLQPISARSLHFNHSRTFTTLLNRCVGIFQTSLFIHKFLNFYNTFMKLNNLLYFLFLVAFVVAAPLIQQDVDTFIRGNNLIPPAATLKTFSSQEGKALVAYGDQFTTFKFVIGQNQEGKPFVIFRQQMTQFSFSNNHVNQGAPQMIFMPQPMIAPPVPQIEILRIPQIGQRFDQQMMSGNVPAFPMETGRRMPNHRTPMPCRINEEDVKTLLKENLVIFANAEVQNIQKMGFERGNGIVLEIFLANEGKQYKIRAGYMPRWRRLNVMKIEQLKAKEQKTALETGHELIGKVINSMPQPENFIPEQPNFNFESMIQSFVEKLLARKNQKIEEVHEQTQETAKPPVLLGSEDEKLNPTKLEVPESETKPLLLGSEGQVENPFRFEDNAKAEEAKETEKEQEKEDHHKEEKSEQISQLVTEVLSKIKLQTK